MKRYVNLIRMTLGWLFVATLTACEADKDETTFPEPAGSIRVYTGIQNRDANSPQGEELKACLIFWREQSYKTILDGNWPTNAPYLVARPEEEIDYYQWETGISYDTQRSYPTGGSHVHVTGFAPAGLTSDNNYQTLTIPTEMQDGKVDFLSGDGNNKRTGTAEQPFVNKGEPEETQKERQLEFCHLTAKIRFEAERDASMINRIGVRNVKVTLKEQSVPTYLQWQSIPEEEGMQEGGGYFPAGPVSSTIVLNAPTDEPILQSNPQKVDSCYVFTYEEDRHFHRKAEPQEGTITLKMDIEAELMPPKTGAGEGGWDTEQIVRRKWEDLTVNIQSTTGDRLKMGYAYQVTIKFNIFDLRLQGMEVPWEDGGLHYVPITPVDPFDPNSQEEVTK